MENKLTPQIAALYLGQKCQSPEGEGIILGVDNVGNVEVEFGIMGPDFSQIYEVGEILPILRRLDSLTENEARELYQVCYPSDTELDAESFLGDWWNKYDEWYVKTKYFIFGKPAAWLKLLSWGFDLFGLIDSGLAIDAATLKTETVK